MPRWLIAYAVLYFFDSVLIAFNTLQTDASVLERQYGCLENLAQELQTHIQAAYNADLDPKNRQLQLLGETIVLGQFGVNSDGARAMCSGISVEACELEESLEVQELMQVLQSVSILYLVALNGIAVILRGRESHSREVTDLPQCLPMSFANMSVVDFVKLVKSHKHRLKTVFDDAFIQKVTDQHKLLVRSVAVEPALRLALEASSKKPFHLAWSPAGSRFSDLLVFAGGMACVMPTTSRVEGDFCLMCYRRDDNCAGLTDFSLEGVMHSKQYTVLQKATSLLT